MYGINNFGAVVGTYTVGVQEHGFIESSGVYTTIDYPGVGEGRTSLTGINDFGVVTGYYYDTNNIGHAFTKSNGVFTFIDRLGLGDTYIYPSGINNDNIIVGAYTSGAELRGFTGKDGNYASIAVPGSYRNSAMAINGKGNVAGWYVDHPGPGAQGFVFDGAYMTAINDLNAPFDSTYVEGINDAGDLTGFNSYGFTDHSFVATLQPAAAPVPEPASWVLMLGGFLVTGIAARSRYVNRAATVTLA